MNLTRYLSKNKQKQLMELIAADDGHGVSQSCISKWLLSGVPKCRHEQLERVTDGVMTAKALMSEMKRKRL